MAASQSSSSDSATPSGTVPDQTDSSAADIAKFVVPTVVAVIALYGLMRWCGGPWTGRNIPMRQDPNVRPEVLTGDNLPARPQRARRSRERAQHFVHPREPGWTPAIMRSSPVGPLNDIDLERGDLPPYVDGASRPTGLQPVVPGGHPNCQLAAIAGDGDHFVHTEPSSAGPHPPPYQAFGLHSLLTHTTTSESNHEVTSPPYRAFEIHHLPDHQLPIVGNGEGAEGNRRLAGPEAAV